jgi:hypothetical protein
MPRKPSNEDHFEQDDSYEDAKRGDHQYKSPTEVEKKKNWDRETMYDNGSNDYDDYR